MRHHLRMHVGHGVPLSAATCAAILLLLWTQILAAQGEVTVKQEHEPAAVVPSALKIERKAIRNGYDRKTCWVHPRPGIIPGVNADARPTIVVTMQKLRLTGSDVFYALNEMRTDNGGETWTDPVEHTKSLGRRELRDGVQEGICDFWPAWHHKTGVMLGTGHTVRYQNDNIPSHIEPRDTAYSVYNSASHTWSNWKRLKTPHKEKFSGEGAGSTQRVDLPNGDILLPTYFIVPEKFAATANGMSLAQYAVTVTRCSFDGQTLRYVEHGDEFTIPSGRGMTEPSLALFAGKYFLTIRNDDCGYVTSGKDGLHFDEPRRWTFDDGSELGNYNTQQHWVTMPDALYLVYTRRGAKNDHVFRHRAPLFIAQVDPQRLCVIRKTERVLVPDRGARLGNFGVVKISDTESWVTVAEWMQTTMPNPYDSTVCEKYGSDNSIWLAKISSHFVRS